MSFPEDAPFLWIAEQAISAELPGNWCMRRDPELLVYFYDPDTSVASRQHPADEQFRSMYYAHKFARSDSSRGGSSDTGASYLSTLVRCAPPVLLTPSLLTTPCLPLPSHHPVPLHARLPPAVA